MTTYNKRMRLSERLLPEKLSPYIPESKMYNNLIDLEKKVDYLTIQKRLQLQESLGKPVFRKRVLRIFLSNMAANQSSSILESSDNLGQMADPNSSEMPSWTLKMEGRFIDTIDPNFKNKPAPRKFSEQFTLILIELDRPDFPPQENIIEWRQTPQAKQVDGFEIKRLGDKSVNVKISFFLKYSTQKFKIANPALCELLGINEPISKVSLVSLVWQYIKNNGLVDSTDSDCVKPDPTLQKIFGNIQIMFSSIPELLLPFYAPVDPIVLNYTVKVDSGEEHKLPYAFDIPVEVEEPIKSRLGILPSLQAKQKELAALDEQQQKLIQAIFNSKIKCDFLRKFSNDPVNFVNRLVDTMSHDLAVITGEQKSKLKLVGTDLDTGKDLSDPELFSQPWAHEAVFHYLINSDRKKESSSSLRGAIESVSSSLSNTSQNKTAVAPIAAQPIPSVNNPNLVPNANSSQGLVPIHNMNPSTNVVPGTNTPVSQRLQQQSHLNATSSIQMSRASTGVINATPSNFGKSGQPQSSPFISNLTPANYQNVQQSSGNITQNNGPPN